MLKCGLAPDRKANLMPTRSSIRVSLSLPARNERKIRRTNAKVRQNETQMSTQRLLSIVHTGREMGSER